MKEITAEIQKLIDEGTGKYKNLLIFKGISDGKIYPRYVKEEENIETIITRCTGDIIYMGTNFGKLLELEYNHNYDNKQIDIEKIPFEKLYEINKGVFGYIDPYGNFYPLGKIEEHKYRINKKYKAGKIADAIVHTLNLPKEEIENYEKGKKDFLESHYSPGNWPANKILKSKRFCLFFRGISDDGIYDDQSYYENANKRQLLVLSYLYTLNSIHDIELEENRKSLIKKLINSEQK